MAVDDGGWRMPIATLTASATRTLRISMRRFYLSASDSERDPLLGRAIARRGFDTKHVSAVGKRADWKRHAHLAADHGWDVEGAQHITFRIQQFHGDRRRLPFRRLRLDLHQHAIG